MAPAGQRVHWQAGAAGDARIPRLHPRKAARLKLGYDPLRHLVIEIDARASIALAGGNPAALACHAALARTRHCTPPVAAPLLPASPPGRGGWAAEPPPTAR